jgi:hypothetical protein
MVKADIFPQVKADIPPGQGGYARAGTAPKVRANKASGGGDCGVAE